MLKKIRVAIILAALTAALAGAANTELALNPPLSATLAAPTCTHEAPDSASPTLMCFSNAGLEMKLVARMMDKDTVEGKTGYWYKAAIGDSSVGWIFSSYVTIAAAGGCDGKCDSCGRK